MTTSDQRSDPPRGSRITGESSAQLAREYLTIEELAARSGLSVSTLRRLRKKGLIAGIQPGGPRTRLVFKPDAIEQMVSAPAPLPPAPDTATPRPPLRGPAPRWRSG
jgi:excisionase family DNA binding protein